MNESVADRSVSLRTAAAELGLPLGRLQRAVAGGVLPTTVVGRRNLCDVEELRAVIAGLPECPAPGCRARAISPGGGCGALGHSHSGRTRPAEWGEAIARRKRGKPQVEKPEGAVTLTEAWQSRAFGVGKSALEQGVVLGRLRHTKTERPAGRTTTVIMFDAAELVEDLAKWPCTFPGCESPAPAESRRCGRHPGGGQKYETLAFVCEQCRGKFTRPGSWIREMAGRGRFCSNSCQMAWKQANDSRFQLAHLAATPQAIARLRRIDADVAGLMEVRDLVLVSDFARATGTSPSQIRELARRGTVPAEIHILDGSKRMLLPRAAIETYPQAWVRGDRYERNRERYFEPDFVVRQQSARVGRLVARGLTPVQAEAAVRASVIERRRFFVPRKSGRKRADHNARWVAQFDEIREWYREQAELELLPEGETVPTDRDIYMMLAEQDAEEHPGRWKYKPADRPEAAMVRVYTAIKRHRPSA